MSAWIKINQNSLSYPELSWVILRFLNFKYLELSEVCNYTQIKKNIMSLLKLVDWYLNKIMYNQKYIKKLIWLGFRI